MKRECEESRQCGERENVRECVRRECMKCVGGVWEVGGMCVSERSPRGVYEYGSSTKDKHTGVKQSAQRMQCLQPQAASKRAETETGSDKREKEQP